jgi:thymidylate kinase
MDTQSQTGKRLLASLKEKAVQFTLWKSNLHLAQALSGETDLDILVDALQLPQFRESVASAGAIHILSQSWASYPGVEDWLACDKDTGKFLHLHVHTQLVTGLKRVKHLALPWTEFVLTHTHSDSRTGWPVPEAEIELLVLLIRIWAKMPPLQRLWKPHIPSHILAELRWLEAQTDAQRFLAYASTLGIAPPALPPFADEGAILAAAKSLYKQVRQYRRKLWPVALLAAAVQGLKLAATRFWLKWIGPVSYRKRLAGTGALVAIIGSDGSGKSTQSQRLLAWLNYKLDAHLLYMGSGDGETGTANQLRKFLSRTWKMAKPRTIEADRSGKSPKMTSFVTRIWRLFDLMLLRRKLRLLRRARAMASEGSIILLDRYPQSKFPGISDGPRQVDGRGFLWAAEMEQRLLAEAERLGPDLLIKLRVSPEVAKMRKPDHAASVISRKCQVVDELAFAHAETLVLDADALLDTVTSAAQIGLWTFISDRQQDDH